ncbi:MAG TPA: metallopeptidase TldD-related protein, partial [Planctomycetota bacterium]
MRIAFASLLLLAAGAAPQDDDDLIFRVLRDERQRSLERLKLEKSGPPYYLEYTVTESESFQVSGSFGAVTGRGGGKSRYCSIDLRVGDRTLDNTNFAGASPGGGTSFTVDDDYDALRHELWLATDREYKSSIEELEKKKAFLQQNTVQDRPDDLSTEEPVVLVRPTVKLEVDRERWSAAVRKVSAVFREFPKIQKSVVTFYSRSESKWFLNNEGFKNRGGEVSMALVIGALIQADDGMKLSDAELFAGTAEKDLPSPEAAEKTARDLAQRLERLAAAPKAEEYRGPILFEGQAGAEFFALALTSQLGSSHEQLGRGGSGGNPWREQIGQRVAAAFISVISDPTAREYNGTPILGGYDIDDDGVRGQKLTLIDKGVLKTFCMSRIPTRNIKKSNGHSRDGVGGPSTIFIESAKKLPREELMKRLF